ncbi:MAG: BrnT family toxin [Nitrospira sp.]|nr:BrnT family toxin [Nitrospira sp.]
MQNIRKHGVSFTEAVESFLDPHGFQLTDSKEPRPEGRGSLLISGFLPRFQVV